MEFTEKTFKITENVSFSILIAYFDGHPICQTKSLKLNYHGQLQEMKSGNRLYNSLIPEGIRTKEALNLINYLGRLIYDENVYDVYVNNSNQSDYVSEMKEYMKGDYFAKGSMYPKVNACVMFLTQKPGKTAIISSLTAAKEAFQEKTGTIIK